MPYIDDCVKTVVWYREHVKATVQLKEINKYVYLYIPQFLLAASSPYLWHFIANENKP